MRAKRKGPSTHRYLHDFAVHPNLDRFRELAAGLKQKNAAVKGRYGSVARIHRLILVASHGGTGTPLNLTYLLQIQQNEGDFPRYIGRIRTHALDWLLR